MMELTTQIIASTPNPIYVKNAQGRFVQANDAFARLHGLTVPQLLEEGEVPFDYAEDRDIAVLASGEPVAFEEFYRLESGEKMWYKTSKQPFTSPDGSQYLLSTSCDITALKKALQSAEDTAQRKEEFLSNMSSEIRTPVNAILGMARLLKKSMLNKHQEEYLNTIMSIAEDLLVIPNDILEFSKLESGVISLASFPFSVDSTLENITDALKTKAEEHGIRLRYAESKESIPVVEGDSFRLSQILIALVSNAIKYSSQGEISVTATVRERSAHKLSIEFCVKSTGLGMIANKFTDFDEVNHNSSLRYGSTGLGFNLCKTLIEIQGGKMWIEGKSDRESSFYFTLPFRICDKPPVPEASAQVLDPEPLKGVNVLLVEDNQVNQLLVTSQLQAWGTEVDLAFDGAEAIAKTKEKKYDTILMDIQMPRLNGIEATSRIRQEANLNKDTPIVAFTANVPQIEIEKFKHYGFSDYLLKPYPIQKLYEVLSRHTDCSHGPKQLPPQHELEQEAEEDVPLFDFSGLGDLAQDTVFIHKMQKLFVETVPDQLLELSEAVKDQEWEKTVQLAHRLKSTFGNIKIRQATELMKAIEETATKKPDKARVASLLERAGKIIDEVLAEFSEQLKAFS
ncbi:MAG: response regulator [Hymenobacteraceae bacterium]|nr:response regulator [Hymenobacteraceae bacterium]